MSMKLVTEVFRKGDEYNDVILLENEVLCIDRKRQRVIAARMGANDVLRALRHLTALALEELEWRKSKLLSELKEINNKIDELVEQASNGVYYERWMAEDSMRGIIDELNNISKRYDEVTNAINKLGVLYEHLYEILDKIPDIIALYNKAGLWV